MTLFKHSILVGLLLGTLAGCGSSTDTAAEFVEHGKELVADGKLNKASIEFRNAIQLDPRQPEPYYQLALIDEKMQNWTGMLKNLTTVEQLDPKHVDAILKLGHIFLISEVYEEVKKRVDVLLELDKSNPDVWILSASLKQEEKQFDEAMDDIDQALTLAPKNYKTLSLKAQLFAYKNDPEQALSFIDQALNIKPDDKRLTDIKLSLLEWQKKYPEIEEIYRTELREKPDDNKTALALAQLLNKQNRHDDAKQFFEEFIADNPDDDEAKLFLITLIKEKSPDEALTKLTDYIEKQPDNYKFRFLKSDLLSKSGQKEQSIAILKQIVKEAPETLSGIGAALALAKIDLHNGDMEAARQKVTDILTFSPDNEAALIIKARINLVEENLDDAITDLRVVVDNNPESEDGLILLGSAYANYGSQDLADDSFRKALHINPANKIAALFVATKLMQQKQLDEAEKILTFAKNNNEAVSDSDKKIIQMLVQIKVLKQDWQGIAPLITSLQLNNKDTFLTHYLKAIVAQGTSLFADAVTEYKKVLAEKPDMPQALEGLAASMMQLNQKDQLIIYLQQFIDKNPEQTLTYGLLAKLYSIDEKWAQAISLLEQGIAIEPKWQQGYIMLASVYMSQNNTDKAESALQRGLDTNKDDQVLMLELAKLYEINQQFKKAMATYEAILAINPDVELAINNLASILSDYFPTEENLKKAAGLSRRFKQSEQVYYADTYAWTQVLLGKYEVAQKLLERVISLSPDVAVFNYHIGMLHLKQGQQMEAKNYLNIAKSLAEQQGDKVTAENVEKALKSL